MSYAGSPGGPAEPVEEPRCLVTSQPAPQPQPTADEGAQR